MEDRFPRGTRERLALPPRSRVVYVVEGGAVLEGGATSVRLEANTAWQGGAAVAVTAGGDGARVWRWELVAGGDAVEARVPGGSVGSALKLAHVLDLDPRRRFLVRCDRVDFPLSGVAYTHTHQGPGIRCLLRGELRVTVNGKETLIRRGEAWFEKGPDPVFAAASPTELTSFVRVMILPVELLGKSSICYANAEDRDKPKTQRYTVFLDEPIEV